MNADQIVYELLKGQTLERCVAAFCATEREAKFLRDAYHARKEGVTLIYGLEQNIDDVIAVGIALAEHHIGEGCEA